MDRGWARDGTGIALGAADGAGTVLGAADGAGPVLGAAGPAAGPAPALRCRPGECGEPRGVLPAGTGRFVWCLQSGSAPGVMKGVMQQAAFYRCACRGVM